MRGDIARGKAQPEAAGAGRGADRRWFGAQ
jgi:hypothetical protein